MTVMTRTIEFDRKLGFLAKEIHDAIADRVLSTKLCTCGFAGAQGDKANPVGPTSGPDAKDEREVP